MKTDKNKKNLRQKGQLTIFFSVSMLAVITMLAFLINVGLFVKAKINLQNAVDAAAWSGAATQARQLTEIAYLNWEMRNVYKEWMFKYYVLGSLSINEVRNSSSAGSPNAVDQGNGGFNQYGEPVDGLARANDGKIQFYMLGGKRSDIAKCRAPIRSDGSGREGCPDRFNFPSVCMHIQDTSDPVPDICKMYNIPGLPEIGVSNLPGVDQSTQNFIDKLVEKKADNCIERSDLNFLVAVNWAYGVKRVGANSSSALAGSPQIAIDRTGAFPNALELAIRVRTLEHIVNRPAVEGICSNSGNDVAGTCVQDLATLTTENTPHNERPVKSFYSAYRNLGNSWDNEMKESLVLTELSPQEYEPVDGGDSLSYTFMPPQPSKRLKYYLDLRPMVLNLATFYTSFIPKAGTAGRTDDGARVTSSGDCSVTKVALPVPGYPIGFTKNPAVVTYYAVKGEANFMGLLNPFTTDNNGFVKLTTYAAAKPFGGRIGPHLFETFADIGSGGGGSSHVVTSRSDPLKSYPYTTGLQLPSGSFNFGDPVPLTSNFWIIDPEEQLGGWISPPVNARFTIPNMIYEYIPGNMGNQVSSASGTKVKVLNPDNDAEGDNEPGHGLYDKAQYELFRANLFDSLSGGSNLDATTISRAINLAKAPTKYDSMNYLIPALQSTHSANTGLSLDTIGYVTDNDPWNSDSEHTNYKLHIYAPLYSDKSQFLYNEISQIEGMVNTYFENRIDGSVEKYLTALHVVAQRIIALTGDARYQVAAEGVSNSTNSTGVGGFVNCSSIAAKMAAYLLGPAAGVIDRSACPVAFKDNLFAYWDERKGGKTLDTHQGEYTVKNVNPRIRQSDIFTAYRPGDNQGADSNGIAFNRILGSSSDMRRNYYSTKFVSLRSISTGVPGGALYDPSQGGTGENYSEESSFRTRNTGINAVNLLLGLDLDNVYR